MRIQHNIMAMNAYRNYTNNVSAMKKNLEKLSSGYKINRAGDDAAGLAISEKMRAQITGLQQAQANAKSGINLVQTAEGALTEVHDMLNRMVKLADQSANGTYDNDVDRVQLQKEMDQLNAEIDRIADSANFNGIKLFDGSMDGTSTSTIDPTTISGERTGIFVPQIDHDNDATTDEVDAVNMGDQGWALYTHKDATGAAKTSFEARLSNYEVNGLKEGEEVTISLKLTNTNNTENEIAGDNVEITVNADENGQVTGKMIADAVAKHYKDNSDGKVNLTNSSGVAIEYNVTSKDGALVFEMSDKGYQDAAAAYKKEPWTDAKNWVFRGNYNIKMETTVARNPEITGAGADATTKASNALDQLKAAYTSDKDGNTAIAATPADNSKVYDAAGNEFTVTQVKDGTDVIGYKLTGDVKVGQGWTDNSTAETKMGTAAAGTQLADGLIGSPEGGAWKRWSFKDASGIKIGDTNYVFATTDDTVKAKFDANTKVIDLRDLVNEDGEMKDDAKLAEALHRVADAAGDNKMWSVQVSNSGTFLAIREREDYNGNGEGGRADLTTREGIEATVQLFNKAKAHTTETAATGRALTLQIGDTADSFNQLKVNIGDMHASALGLDKIRIDDQESAAKAIDVIRAAINTVSDVRGTLGATQNRLDHTINNLSVMTENIQDAESTIRDTDVAEEMMAYTKNNILIQSAQAMLAQANQVPQGVLQLLQ